MQFFLISATWALLTVLASASASSQAISARQTTLVYLTLEIEEVNPIYNVTVPEDGSTVQIPTSDTIYSIISSEAEAADCVFLGVDGSVNHIETSQVDIIPTPLISVACCPADNRTCPAPASVSSSSTASSSASSSITTGSSVFATTSLALGGGTGLYPPYSTGTVSGSGTASAGSSASSLQGPGSSKSTGTPIAFIGDAGKFATSIGAPLFAFAGLFLAF